MTRASRLRSFLRRDDGSTSVEFVIVFLGFIAIFLFVVEVALYMYFTASLEKAAEAGVRAAVVSDPARGSRQRNIAIGATAAGAVCTPATCQALPTIECDGDCNGASFTRILTRMRGFNGQIKSENVAIRYSNTGIGFAGGPATPMVTVTVHDVPFQTGVMGLLLARTADWASLEIKVATLPPRSASMTGEDLAR